jgi:hypothetical protein
MDWSCLNSQMSAFSPRLTEELKLTPEAATKLASMIAADVRFLSQRHKNELQAASPVPFRDRLTELVAFQAFMDRAGAATDPTVIRAQVIVQNYICFVYLPESCFRILRKVCGPGSTTAKCSKYLTDNPIRAFRNAVAHANWTYKEDFSGLIYWARKGDSPEEPLVRFEVNQADLGYWQALSRCVAYAALSNA